jgi:hypothetical protein
VGEYLKSVHLGQGYSWCAAFVNWCYNHCGVYTSINGWAASTDKPSNRIYYHGKFNGTPRPGDTFTVWSTPQKRIVHTGFYSRKINDTFFETVEGNSNGGGSSNGDGVYKLKRSIHAVYSINRWL